MTAIEKYSPNDTQKVTHKCKNILLSNEAIAIAFVKSVFSG